jgi:flagellar biosynthesis/type III secretory pathway protein FliH
MEQVLVIWRKKLEKKDEETESAMDYSSDHQEARYAKGLQQGKREG